MSKIFFFPLLLLCFDGWAQSISRYNTFGYNVNEGLLQSTIIDIGFDENNFCWIAFPNGIQKFDGKTFTSVPVQGGLPDDKHCNFFRSTTGQLFISHTQGVSIYDISTDKFKLVYQQPSRQAPPFLGECDNVIYFYNGNAAITGINNTTFKEVSKYQTGLIGYNAGLEYYPRPGKNVSGEVAVFILKKTICFWNLSKGKLIHQTKNINGLAPYLLYLKNNEEAVFVDDTKKGTLNKYHYPTGKSTSATIKGLENIFFSRCNIYRWKGKILLSVNDRVYETDSSFLTLKNELVNFQNQPVSGGTSINAITEDNFGNLLLRTVNGGIKKIIRFNYPIKFYNTGETGKNNALSVLPDKKQNRVLIGTNGYGIQAYDTLQQLKKNIKITTINKQLIGPNALLQKPNGNYVAFSSGKPNAWELSSNLSYYQPLTIQLNNVADKERLRFFGNILTTGNEAALVQTQGLLHKINWANNTISSTEFSSAYILGGLYNNGQIISHADDELLYIDTATLKIKHRISFKNTGGVRCFLAADSVTIYMGTNKGIFVIDLNGKIQQHFSKASGLPDECIYAMVFDEEKNLWCSTNRGILKIKDGKVLLHLKKEDGLQENEFNTNVVAKATDGELFFGGVNGVTSFFPWAITNDNDSVQVLITHILANNENAATKKPAWDTDEITLPYTKNTLAFDFAAMGCFNPDQYVYQYCMKGLDKEWIQTNTLQTVRYSLPPGKYTLQVYASRFYNTPAKPLKELVIIIKPPFWKSWWFLSGMVVFTLAVFGYAINSSNKKKYAKKLQQLENERQLKEERERISKDLHDSLGAYANAVLYNTGLLEKENEQSRQHQLIGGLKFASKNIITSLRETVWALKKETYTAEDCMVRIRNYTQSLAKNYTDISISVQGSEPAALQLHYTKALNIVRIVQEAVSNCLKHANATAITVVSTHHENNWTLQITDNGKGFDAAALTNEETGNGLHNMKHRAADSGITFQLLSEKNKGTVITIKI